MVGEMQRKFTFLVGLVGVVFRNIALLIGSCLRVVDEDIVWDDRDEMNCKGMRCWIDRWMDYI